MSEKEQFVKICCDFYNKHSESDKQWFARNYDQCDEAHEKNNTCMFRWQFPLLVLRTKQSEINQLKAELKRTKALAEKALDVSQRSSHTEMCIAQELNASSNPEMLESERQMNALLTNENLRLEAEKAGLGKTAISDCLHFCTTMFHDGKATCFGCDAVVNHDRKVIGVMEVKTLRGTND